MIHLIVCDLACLAIAALYYTYRDVYQQRRQRSQLRERVGVGQEGGLLGAGGRPGARLGEGDRGHDGFTSGV